MNALRNSLLACAAVFLLNGNASAYSFFHHDSAPRHARKAGAERHGTYPLGAREFYYQYAESRGAAYPSDTVAGGFALMGFSEPGARPEAPPAPLQTMASSSHVIASDAPRAEAIPERPSSPAGLALPAAALGLMLFVARRRSTSL